jgi:hypothetical protein
MWMKIPLAAVMGALLGLLLHVMWTPALDGQCTIICHPVRSPVAFSLLTVGVVIAHHALTKDVPRGAVDDESD